MIGTPRAAEALKGEAAPPAQGAAAFLVRSLMLATGLTLAGCSSGPSAPTAAAPATFTGAVPAAATTAGLSRPGGALDRLDGMRASEVVALLGQPELRRVDPPAELWQYRTARCVLDVYLYREGDGVRVRHVEARQRDGLDVAGGCAEGGVARDARLTENRL